MINDILRLVLTGLLLLIIQIAARPLLSIFGAYPDLLLIFTLMVTFTRGRYAGLIAGLFAGLMQDVITVSFIGIYALSKSTVAFWVGSWLDRRESAPRPWLWLVLIAVATIIQELIGSIFLLQGSDLDFSGYFFGSILPISIYTAILGFIWVLAPIKTGKQRTFKPTSSSMQRLK